MKFNPKYLIPRMFLIKIEMLELMNISAKIGAKFNAKTGALVESGIVLPEKTLKSALDRAEAQLSFAKVLEMSPTAYKGVSLLDGSNLEPQCKEGDIVVIARYGGYKVPDFEENETNIRFIRDTDIMAIVDPRYFEDDGEENE